VDIEANQNILDNSHNLFTVLSSSDNLKIFSAARDGLKISTPLLDRLGISKRRCNKALEQLKDAGLIEKYEGSSGDSGSSYIHTTFGSIVYRRNILEMDQYTKYSDQMQIIDTIKRAQRFSEGAIAMFNEEIINNIVRSGRSGGGSHSMLSSSVSPSFAISSYDDISSSDGSTNSKTISNARIIPSYDNIVQLLRERIEYCKNEILIATRTSPEVIINKILQKSKLGIKVKVVADIDLVKEYFESQEQFTADSDNIPTHSNKNNPKHKEKNSSNMNMINTGQQHQRERKNVISNPYYPNTAIHRRISDIPFSMIILDSNEVGLELVNSNNTKEFFAGVWIKDEKFATAMKSFYQTIWDRASENIDI
jgi:hypothetical protein